MPKTKRNATSKINLKLKKATEQVDRGESQIAAPVIKTFAEQGDPLAMVYWGWMHHQGLGAQKDWNKARQLFEAGARKGNPRGFYYLGLMALSGEGEPPMPEKAFEYFRLAAEEGEVFAMHQLGQCYFFAIGTDENSDLGIEWEQKAADLGFGPAELELGRFYAKGWGVPEDHRKAEYYLERAAKKGVSEAIEELATLYFDPLDDSPKKSAKANKWAKDFLKLKERKAAQGSLEDMFILAEGYFQGSTIVGGRKDLEKAAKWARTAAEEGEPRAQILWGRMLHAGQGVSAQPEKGLEWIKKAAQEGLSEADFWLENPAADESEYLKFLADRAQDLNPAE